jgi:dienelactone hydrolase
LNFASFENLEKIPCMGAYMARLQAPGSYPGAIVCFELFGVTSYIQTFVDRIAQLGYVVLAPDFYHRSLRSGQIFDCQK